MFNEFITLINAGEYNDAISSTVGLVLTLVVAAILLILILTFTGKEEKGTNKAKSLAYSGVAVAIAMVLSQIHLVKFPQGGSITPFSMLFIILIGYFYGVRKGILVGIVYGLLQMVIDPQVYYPVQFFLDYPLAFGALGLAGLFAKTENGLMKGLIFGAFARFIFHFLSGAIFFGMYAPEGWNPISYSIAYNIAYIGAEVFLTVVLLMVPGVIGSFAYVKKNAIA